jgi:glycosyltransferase involved in cell wall biosynthesis
MRVALIRGSLLRASELDNFVLPGVDTFVLGSRAVAAQLSGSQPPVVGLPSSGDVLGRLPGRAQAGLQLVAGKTEFLVGMRRALNGVDVAHALELDHPLTDQAVRARDAGACRAVVATVMENIPFPPVANRFVERRVRRIAAGVDRFIAVTERARVHLELNGVDPARITVLPEGIPVDRFGPRPEIAEDAPLSVLTVARLERAKGVEDLVIAIALLARRGIDARVTLVGDGPLAGPLQALARRLGIADRVEVPGAVAWDDLPGVYRSHHVFVLASAPTVNWREQFGFAVVEAMASGLPVLVGESGSLPEVVGEAHSLVAPHDPVSLADALAALAGDPAERRRQGDANRARAAALFDVGRIQRGLIEIYEDVLAGRPARP